MSQGPRRALGIVVRAAALAAGIAGLCGGCVERKLLLRSDPPGARILLNGDEVGVTPVDAPFQTYGVFEIIAVAPQCARLRTTADIRPPWWETIPLDFFVEDLWPWTVRDHQTVALKLEPIAGDETDVTQREAELRHRMESEEMPTEGGKP